MLVKMGDIEAGGHPESLYSQSLDGGGWWRDGRTGNAADETIAPDPKGRL